MRSVAPWTYPSVLSLFSGLYPHQHGANGHPLEDELTRFAPELPLLPRILKAVGYESSAFITNPFLHEWNPFHAGFDSFDAHFVENAGSARVVRGAFTPDMFADSVNASVEARFSAKPVTNPEFTYIHYMDVHGPWEGAPFRGTYRDAVRFMDEKIEWLYDFFRERYGGDVLFLVTSDHGQAYSADLKGEFARPWRKTKASMHDFNLRIPLMILPTDLVTEPQELEHACTSIDVLPTLLDWLDIEPPYRLPGMSQLPAIRGKRVAADERSLYAVHRAFGVHTDCLVHRRRKYVRYFLMDGKKKSRQHVFDLDNDPGEQKSLTNDLSDVEERFAEVTAPGKNVFEGVFGEIPAKTRDQLEALGYLD